LDLPQSSDEAGGPGRSRTALRARTTESFLYYAIGSALTGWSPNPNKYATARTLEGPWSEFRDIAPPEANTYGAQSTLLLKVVGSKATTVIFMGDMWKPRTQWDSRYLWMPVQIDDGTLRLQEPKPWTIDVKTGEATIVK
jgi:hypothetical protein